MPSDQIDNITTVVLTVIPHFLFSLVTPSGLTSIPVGVETPDMIELRKRRIEDAMDQGGDTPALYTVLPEKKTAVGGAMMGSAHIYDISAVSLNQNMWRWLLMGDWVHTKQKGEVCFTLFFFFFYIHLHFIYILVSVG